MRYTELDTPSLLVDREILLRNLKEMQDYADENHVMLRPHTKTHKMPEIAKLQMEQGACGIAVAKIGEAEVMAEYGLTDIFIANELIGVQKFRRIAALAKKIRIAFGVDTPCQVTQAEEVFAAEGVDAEVLIEIEVGENRSGIIGESDFLELLDTIKGCEHVKFKGIFSHDGNCYRAPSVEACLEISRNAQARTLQFADLAKQHGMPCETVSYGSTPPFTCHGPIFPGITELRPGTYAFMDAAQAHAVGTFDHCAATVLASVISRPTKERVILDVGAKGLTMQQRTEGICFAPGKGLLYEDPEICISGMFDEHAIILNEAFREKTSVGDKVRVIPVHICPVCNLYDRAYLISGDEVVKELPIACRGKLQ